jgi:hypothetical protein
MRKSKYLGMQSGDWECTHVGVARVQPAFKKKKDDEGRRVRSKRPGHRTYYYIFERLTSDKKAMKMIRLNAKQVRQVLDGWITVESVANAKKEMNEAGVRAAKFFVNKVSYSFCD